MPTFCNNPVELTDDNGESVSGVVDIDFEIYCGCCGAGICDHGEVTRTYRRGMNRLDVRPCDSCMKDKDKEIDELKDKISDLESEINTLNERGV